VKNKQNTVLMGRSMETKHTNMPAVLHNKKVHDLQVAPPHMEQELHENMVSNEQHTCKAK
jgi:hypothetical protein